MASYNRTILIGNLTRDPEVRYIPSGTAVAEIGLAVNRTWTDNGEKKEEVTFIDVTLWGKTAELAGQYLAKGRSVMIEGRLQMESWDDKATGQKRSKLKVVGETMQFLGSKDDGGGKQQTSPPRQQQQRTQPTKRPHNQMPEGGWGADENGPPF